MFELIIENNNGDKLEFGMGSPFTITEVQGLGPSEANINTSTAANLDGEQYTGAKLQMRQLNIAFAIEYEAEANRIKAYKVLKNKQPVTVYYKNTSREVFIKGYVHAIDVAYFEMKQTITASILCPQPYWLNMYEFVEDISTIISKFHFPFSSTEANKIIFGEFAKEVNLVVDNDGDSETGITISVFVKKAMTSFKIFNYVTKEYIGVNYSLRALDEVIINTNKGEKDIYLIRSGVKTPLLPFKDKGSTWLVLNIGENVFTYTTSTDNTADALVKVTYNKLYQGV